MTRSVILIVAILMSAVVHAAVDPMQGRYGNTVRITNKAGQLTRIYYNSDKSVTVMGPDGSVTTSTWVIEGGQICIAANAAPMSMMRCLPFVADKKPGDTWTQKGPDGQDVSMTIVPGRI